MKRDETTMDGTATFTIFIYTSRLLHYLLIRAYDQLVYPWVSATEPMTRLMTNARNES